MNDPEVSRWILIRDTLIFQCKLAIDALRDLLLSPLSIICTVIDIFSGHKLSESYFYKLMALGYKTDHWLNLFGTSQNNAVENLTDSTIKNEANVDQLFAQVEALLKSQHNKGGLTASAKSSIDRYLNKIVANGDIPIDQSEVQTRTDTSPSDNSDSKDS